MNPKDYLNRLECMAVGIQHKEEMIAELREKMFSISSPVTDVEKISGTVTDYDKTGTKIAQLSELYTSLNDSINSYYVARNEIIDEIVSLPNPVHVQFLILRYVSFMSLKDISEQMNYSYERIRHLHAEALESFKKMKDSTH